MKGIILAGGKGTRLYPITISTSKQMLPIFDKPMIFYSLSTLMECGIREFLIIVAKGEKKRFERLFKNKNTLGITIDIVEQNEANGIAEAFIIGKDFIENDDVALILGDNLFYGPKFDLLYKDFKKTDGATIFLSEVTNPSDYGVAVFDKNGKVTSLVEKPKIAPSNFAVTGLYFYKNDVTELVKSLKPSKRGELEITDLNLIYCKKRKLNSILMSKGDVWFDMGTPENLLSASEFIKALQNRRNYKIGLPIEIAYQKQYIGVNDIKEHIKNYGNNEIKIYLKEKYGV